MSAQLEDGYTMIANELLERLPKFKLNGTQLRVIMIVWRYTYGFKRKDHEMSLSFFVKATGLGKTQIDRELTNLIENKVLVVTEESTYTKSRKLGFNKHLDDWKLEYSQPKEVQSAKTLTVSKNADEQSAEMRTPTVSKNADQEIKTFKEIHSTEDDFRKVSKAYAEIHAVMDLPYTNNTLLSKLLDEEIPADHIIGVMKEKYRSTVTTLKFYEGAIRDSWNITKISTGPKLVHNKPVIITPKAHVADPNMLRLLREAD